MGEGYVVDEAGLAARVGELNACASEVASVIGLLGDSVCDIGPGELPAAVLDVLDEWRTNLADMRDKIDRAAENTRDALSNYQFVEHDSEQRMRALANDTVVENQMNVIRGAAVVTLAEQQREARP